MEIFRNSWQAARQSMVNDDLKTLIDFLGRLGPEVGGRDLRQPHDEAALKLERFARGDCAEAERREVCELLRANPGWLRWVADRVKAERAPGTTLRS